MGDAEGLDALALAQHGAQDAVDAVAVDHRPGVPQAVGVLEERQARGNLHSAIGWSCPGGRGGGGRVETGMRRVAVDLGTCSEHTDHLRTFVCTPVRVFGKHQLLTRNAVALSSQPSMPT